MSRLGFRPKKELFSLVMPSELSHAYTDGRERQSAVFSCYRNYKYRSCDDLNIIQVLDNMAKKSLKEVIAEHKDLGFDQTIIQIAYANVDGDHTRVLQEIFRLQQESSSFPTKPSNPQDEDAQLSKAIEESMREAKDKKISLQPLNPQQRVRKSGVPVGLKNIGNTCYFNSLLQTYFQNIKFVKHVLAYQVPAKYKNIRDEDIQKMAQTDFQFKRKLASCRLVENLKNLFCGLIASDRKYIDPTSVISSIVDDYGNQLAIGDQKDIGQFNLVFLSRIEDGLQEARGEQGKRQDQNSPSKIKSVGRQDDENGILRRSSIRLHQRSIVGEQFIGKIENTFINRKEGIEKSEQQLFSLLFVNVKNRELYQACEQFTVSHIDDYRNQKGEVVGVQKHSWIVQPPKTLFFQIDRVVYDKTTLTSQKINDCFDFPNVFYIDPFLHKNKHEALKIQQTVAKLRKQKQQFLNAIDIITKNGQKQINLLEMMSNVQVFFEEQKGQMQGEYEVDNPIFLPKLQNQVDSKFITVISSYKAQLQSRVQKYNNSIRQIQVDIQKCYRGMYSTPYYLYSLLIHEGSAQSGHYYSYTYDQHSQKWHKYNDINITEEATEQVLKEGRGINSTSAYYLVYAQQDVLASQALPKLTHSLSSQPNSPDLYSSFLSGPQRAAVQADNHQLYYDIQQYKMNGFVNRVVDVYSKKFQSFNEVFRKNKEESHGDKKKNTPPLLTNLPLYVKSIDQGQYKNLLISQAIKQYGPKEPSPVFQQQLLKKLGNFNSFKKPAKLFHNQALTISFVDNYQSALTAQRLFESIQKEEYNAIFVFIRELMRGQSQDYFPWLGRLLLKIFVVRFLFESERDAASKGQQVMEKLTMVTLIMSKYINRQDQKMLYMNTLFWINEIYAENNQLKEPIEELLKILDGGQYNEQFAALERRGDDIYAEMVKGIDLSDVLWNASREENTVIKDMIQRRQRIKGKFQVCNKLYNEMKKNSYPLNRQERNNFFK